jgi:ribosomal protein L5
MNNKSSLPINFRSYQHNRQSRILSVLLSSSIQKAVRDKEGLLGPMLQIVNISPLHWQIVKAKISISPSLPELVCHSSYNSFA